MASYLGQNVAYERRSYSPQEAQVARVARQTGVHSDIIELKEKMRMSEMNKSIAYLDASMPDTDMRTMSRKINAIERILLLMAYR